MADFESRVKEVIRTVLQPYLYDGGLSGFDSKGLLGQLIEASNDPDVIDFWEAFVKAVAEELEEKSECDLDCSEVEKAVSSINQVIRSAQSRGLLRPVLC